MLGPNNQFFKGLFKKQSSENNNSAKPFLGDFVIKL
jgi:hypothetical protein